MTSRPFPHLPRWVVIVLLVSAGFLLATLPFLALTLGLRSDFLAFYTSGYLVLQGQAHELYNFDLYYALQEGWLPDMDHPFRFLYAPVFALSYLPIAVYPLAVARGLWVLLSLFLVSAAAGLSGRLSRLTLQESVLALLAFPPLYATLLVGQNSSLTLLVFTAIGLLLWKKQNNFLAGLLAGCLLYKPQLLVALLLLWLRERQWRAFAGFLLMAVMVALTSLMVSPSATVEYPFLGQRMVSLMEQGATGSNGSPYAEIRDMMPPGVAPWVAGGLAAAVLATLLLKPLHNRYYHAMLWLAPLLVTPYVANYDLLLLALPMAFLVPHLAGDRVLQLLVALLWIGPLFNVLSPIRLAMWGALLLYGFCFWRSQYAERAARPAPPSP
ncbi:MAG: DUF2029 domain-containing protein [Ardenticatenales bacterium]|nr:DUF2029 domain-containing protein [Ardenticatenales bacterium]